MENDGWTCDCKGKSQCGTGRAQGFRAAGRSGQTMDRRQFIRSTAAAAGALGLLASGKTVSAEERAALAEQVWQAWNEQLLTRGERRLYVGEELTHIAMPMGGIGAGQVFITGRGKLEQWQIVNNFNSSANAPGSFFAVWAKTGKGKAAAKLLEEGKNGPIPTTRAVEFSGEYPFAWLNYLDEELPVQVSLEVYSPFIPLNTKDSGLPAVVFRFTIRNATSAPLEAAIMVSAPNLIGWDGYADFDGVRHRDYIGNENVAAPSERTHVLRMQTRAGEVDRLSEPRDLLTNDRDVAYSMRLCKNLTVYFDETVPEPKGNVAPVFWVGDLSGRDLRGGLPGVLKEVEKGAALIVSGDRDTLLTVADQATSSPKNRVLFEDWESGAYNGWAIEGDCFGGEPAQGPLPGQQGVSGQSARYMVNTSREGDGPTGRAVSKLFKISRRFVHLLVGGGNHPDQECVNLRVDGEVVATATGDNTAQLRTVRWDVSRYLGKKGVIEIVDARTSDWGIVLVDDIVFSDSPGSPFSGQATAKTWRKALPFDWKALDRAHTPVEVDRASPLLVGVSQERIEAGPRWVFKKLRLKPGARVVLQAKDGSPLIIEGPCGKGRIIVCAGSAHRWLDGFDQKRVIGNLLALAAGGEYRPQTGWDESAPFYGTMALAALDADGNVSAMPQWDDIGVLWEDFARDGRFDAATSGSGPSKPGRTWNGALSVPVSLAPDEEKQVTFVLGWHFPNRMRDWRYGLGPPPPQFDYRLGNQYNNWFKNASEVVDYVAANFDRLEQETKSFHRSFYDSTLPHWLLDAVTANLSTIRSPIYIWLEDGTVGGFEGTDACCPMNCTHVYNYAMAAAFIFPELERNVRETDLLVQMNPDEHFIPHRTLLPLSLPRLGNQIVGPYHHALDGELGTILKTHREWRQCGDSTWLRTLWPNVGKVMRHVFRDHDVDGDAVIKGEQPNTYDTHAYGSNTFIGTLYLAALRAAEEMANTLGDNELATECRKRFEKGREGYDRTCWNGEYYHNVYDAPGAAPETYEQNNCWGPGCHADQLLGQWWAHILGLGYVLPPERVRQALSAVYKYNWRRDFSGHEHTQRVFAEGHEKGLLCCTWPLGGRPRKPIRYCDEVWSGIEYHVAASLIYEGMTVEGLRTAKGARDRYTGNQRNPWSEIECGGHYARAMSSYSLLLAASGFGLDAATGTLSYAPRLIQDDFKAFFTSGQCWGSLSQQRTPHEQRNRISVDYGQLELRCLEIEPSQKVDAAAQFELKGPRNPRLLKKLFDKGKCRLVLAAPVLLRAGDYLEVRTTYCMK